MEESLAAVVSMKMPYIKPGMNASVCMIEGAMTKYKKNYTQWLREIQPQTKTCRI